MAGDGDYFDSSVKPELPLYMSPNGDERLDYILFNFVALRNFDKLNLSFYEMTEDGERETFTGCSW